jgi:cytochrome c-type biogenesis protein
MDLNTALTSISLGLLATTSPCVLPLYPGFLAYLSGGQEKLAASRGRYLLGFFVLAGVLSMMLALGAGIALLSIPVGSALAIFIPLSNLLIFSLGVLLLLDKNPFKRLPQFEAPLLSNPFANAFIYGLMYGPIALPCSGPLVVSIFAFSLTVGEFVSKLEVFLWFGLGFGIPLLLLSFLSGAAQRWITRQLALRSQLINRIAGVLLIAIAVYDMVNNLPNILLALG